MNENEHDKVSAASGRQTGCDESDGIIGNVESFLFEAIQGLEPDLLEQRRAGPGRPRVLPELCLWAGLLVCVLRGFSSQLDLWRLLTVKGLWSYPQFAVGDEAVYKRLAAGGTQVLEELFRQIRDLLQLRLAPYVDTSLAPFATEVVALDETTLDPVARMLPALRSAPRSDSALLPGKLAGLFDVRRQQWRHVEHIPNPQQNVKVAARAMVSHLPPGSLILADLGYFGFAWFDALTSAGYWWLSRLRAKTSYTVIHTYYQDATTFDGIIWLGAHRADKAAYAVRLVQFQVGITTYRYITNVHNPLQLTLVHIAQLYARRWDFELAVKMVKRHLKLHLIWASKSTVMLQQVWAVLIVAQVLHALQLEIAGRAGVDPFDVSLDLLVRYLPRLAAAGQDPVVTFIESGRRARFIRPSTRTQARAPDIPPDHITPLPPDLTLSRTPRYAQRRC